MVPDDFSVGDLFPARAADKVLCFEKRVTQHGGGRDHGDKFRGGHGFPKFVEEGPVVDAERWSDAV